MGKAARKKLIRKAFKKALPVLYTEVAGRVFPEHFSPDCCINGTRVAVEVFRRFDIESTVRACRVLVLNPVAAKLTQEEGMPESREVDQRWQDAGAWIIEISDRGPKLNRPAGYDFHVVCFAGGFLVDSAVGQFVRPKKDIVMPPALVVPIDPDKRKAVLSGVQEVTLGNEAGTAIVYASVPRERGYERASGWQLHDFNRKIADLIYGELKRKLKKIGS